MTELLFRDDAYARECDATVLALDEKGGILLDRTVFYATSGGQPGDRGTIVAGGASLPISGAVYGSDKQNILHLPLSSEALPVPGTRVTASLDWPTRHLHMRVHTCLHLLCSLVPFPVTGGQIAADGGRLDFDIADPDAVDRARLTAEINRLISEDHPVTTRWITDEELLARPDMVRTMSVKPPMGTGRVRLVAIGEDGRVDLQPCGGTHVRSTGEIGPIEVAKIENKGKQNRRIRVVLA